MPYYSVNLVIAGMLLSFCVGCKTINHGFASVSNGVASIGNSLGIKNGKHSVFAQRAQQKSVYDTSTQLPQSGGFPVDHYTNSPEFQSLATKTPSSNPFVRAWQNTTTSLSQAMNFKPRVNLPKDEISLETKAEPLEADFYVITGQGLEERGDIAAAASQYQRALDQDANNINALTGMARILAAEERFDEACIALQKARQAHPSNASLANDAGIFFWKHSRLEEALTSLNDAVQLDSNNTRYRNNIATVLVDADQTPKALDHLLAVHTPAGAHYNLGFLLHRQGRDAEARQHFETSLKENPALAPAQAMLARINGASSNSDASPFVTTATTVERFANAHSGQTIQASTTLLDPVPTRRTLQSSPSLNVAHSEHESIVTPDGQDRAAANEQAPPIVRLR